MKVIWSMSALDDFDQLISYIADKNSAAATRVADAIDRTARQLGVLQTGRPGRVIGTYEKIMPRLPYIIAYAVAPGNAIVILRVVHGARDWPPNRWPR